MATLAAPSVAAVVAEPSITAHWVDPARGSLEQAEGPVAGSVASNRLGPQETGRLIADPTIVVEALRTALAQKASTTVGLPVVTVGPPFWLYNAIARFFEVECIYPKERHSMGNSEMVDCYCERHGNGRGHKFSNTILIVVIKCSLIPVCPICVCVFTKKKHKLNKTIVSFFHKMPCSDDIRRYNKS